MKFGVMLSGNFQAGPRNQVRAGIVLPGGADNQLVPLSDGGKGFDALYDTQTSGGPIIAIRNGVVVDGEFGPAPFAMSMINA